MRWRCCPMRWREVPRGRDVCVYHTIAVYQFSREMKEALDDILTVAGLRRPVLRLSFEIRRLSEYIAVADPLSRRRARRARARQLSIRTAHGLSGSHDGTWHERPSARSARVNGADTARCSPSRATRGRLRRSTARRRPRPNGSRTRSRQSPKAHSSKSRARASTICAGAIARAGPAAGSRQRGARPLVGFHRAVPGARLQRRGDGSVRHGRQRLAAGRLFDGHVRARADRGLRGRRHVRADEPPVIVGAQLRRLRHDADRRRSMATGSRAR